MEALSRDGRATFHIAETDYNDHMTTELNRVRVVESRPRDHVVTIHIRPGDVVGVGHRNQQYPEFVWCASEDGHQGWVAESYLEMTGETEAVAVKEYDAGQLTVVQGELLDVLDEQPDFLLCRNAAGAQGWVPRRVLGAVSPGGS
jgi:SH3-like domain-containing protein